MDLESVAKHSRRQEKWQAQASLTWHCLVMGVVVSSSVEVQKKGLGRRLKESRAMRGVGAAGGKSKWRKADVEEGERLEGTVGAKQIRSSQLQTLSICKDHWFGCSLKLSLLPGACPIPPPAACWGGVVYHWGSRTPRMRGAPQPCFAPHGLCQTLSSSPCQAWEAPI